MARFLRATAAGFYNGSETWLCSLGVALLVLSVLMVPTSRLLADDGSGGFGSVPPPAGCLGDPCDKGCRSTPPFICPPTGPNCQIAVAGCEDCHCTWCLINGGPGACQCSCQEFQRNCVGAPASCPSP